VFPSIRLSCWLLVGITLLFLMLLTARQSWRHCLVFVLSVAVGFGIGSACYLLLGWEPLLDIVGALIPSEGLALMFAVVVPGLCATCFMILCLARFLKLDREDATTEGGTETGQREFRRDGSD
jgi:hypothetical protein